MWKAFITLVPSDRPEAQIMWSCLLSFPPTATYFSHHRFPTAHQMLASRLTAYFRKKCVVVTDRRVRLMNEILGCIKFIKMYCWEDAFEQNIHSESRWNVHQSRCSFQIRGIFGQLLSILSPCKLESNEHFSNQTFLSHMKTLLLCKLLPNGSVYHPKFHSEPRDNLNLDFIYTCLLF